MAIGEDGEILGQVRALFMVGALGDLSDGQLLERFSAGRGEAAELAFAALVERHGAMVLRVCRGVLCEPHDAEDAFQATFLVLLRRARSLWVRDSLGPWLHQVAYRTASCLRSAILRRRRLDRAAAAATRESRDSAGDELARVIHEELGRLPERYRAPAVLCDLEGSSHEQAARHLGWPIGTVKSRLTRAREILRDRLRRRGFAPDLGAVAAALRPRGIEALLPPALVDSATRAVIQCVTARTILAGSAGSTAREVLRTMSMIRWLKVGAVLAAGVATVTGALAQKPGPGAGAAPEGAPGAIAIRADDPPAAEVKPGKFRLAVVERGSVEAQRVDSVTDRIEGTTTIISILPEGTRVKKGAKVADLDTATLRDNLKNQMIIAVQAEANYRNARLVREAAELALREYVEGTYKQEQQALKGTVLAARSAIQKAEARLERTRRARKRMDEILATRKEAAPADIVADLDVDDRLDDAGQVIARESMALELAETRLDLLQKFTADRMKKERAADVEQKKSAELAKRAILQLEMDKEAKLTRQIESGTLVAPSDGIVIHANDPGRRGGAQVQIEEGASVRERQLIFSIVDDSGPMQVNTKVHEALVDRLMPGQRARIKVDTFPGEMLTGAVDTVAPLPDPNTIFGDGRKVYTTRVRIDKGLSGLRPGMTAEVDIPIVELDDVLTVPSTSVLRFDGKDQVAVKKPGGGTEWREVTLGAGNGTSVVVKQGLGSGEAVVLHPIALLSEAERRAKFPAPAAPAGEPIIPARVGRPRPRGN